MHEVQRLFPDQTLAPMLAAEDLAARCLEAGPIRAGEPALRPTALPGVWQFASTRGRVVTLHQTEALRGRLRAGIASQLLPSDVSLLSCRRAKNLSGPSCRTWRVRLAGLAELAFSLKGQRLFDTAAEQRIASYVWIGVLVFAAVIVLAALALAPGAPANGLDPAPERPGGQRHARVEDAPFLHAPAGGHAAQLAAAPRTNRARIPPTHRPGELPAQPAD